MFTLGATKIKEIIIFALPLALIQKNSTSLLLAVGRSLRVLRPGIMEHLILRVSPLNDVEILSPVSHTFYSPLNDVEILSPVSHMFYSHLMT